MYKFQFLIALFILLCVSNALVAQPEEKLSAKEYLAMEDYNHALEEYLKLYKTQKDDPEINFNIGLCYLKINDDKSKALPYLEFVYKKGGYKNDELLLCLAKAYTYAYQFDEAIKFFNEYRKKINSKRYPEIDHYIENCESAKTLMKTPVNVTFENLGKDINSKFPDYYPFVTEDHSTLYFTTRREGRSNKLRSWQGYFTSDIYFSKVVAGQWTKPKTIGPMINSAEDEQCVYVSPNGKKMIIYVDNEMASGDLYITEMTGKSKTFPKPVPIEEPVNTAELEFEGCITQDGNMMIIASERMYGGLGGADLYMYKKLPNGHWGDAVDLDSTVNTKYNESFPVFDEKNNVLYFASEGHTNMGGSDIFKSKYDPITQTFGEAVNMGYPINTPEDNLEFTLAANGRDGYVSAVRKEGYGDLDIYKVTFHDVEQQLTVIKGIVTLSDTNKKEIEAVISLLNAQTNEKIDSKNVIPQSGKYVFAAPSGKYTITVESPGYEDYKENVTIYDKSDFVFEIEKNIRLHKPGEAPLTPVTPTANTKTSPVKPAPPKANKK